MKRGIRRAENNAPRAPASWSPSPARRLSARRVRGTGVRRCSSASYPRRSAKAEGMPLELCQVRSRRILPTISANSPYDLAESPRDCRCGRSSCAMTSCSARKRSFARRAIRSVVGVAVVVLVVVVALFHCRSRHRAAPRVTLSHLLRGPRCTVHVSHPRCTVHVSHHRRHSQADVLKKRAREIHESMDAAFWEEVCDANRSS